MKIRNEVHTRSKFASDKYYQIVRNFVRTNISIKEKKMSKEFKMLSGIETHVMHKDLERCYRIYDHYKKEYNTTLDILNSDKP